MIIRHLYAATVVSDRVRIFSAGFAGTPWYLIGCASAWLPEYLQVSVLDVEVACLARAGCKRLGSLVPKKDRRPRNASCVMYEFDQRV
jgi:hypothetical protein